MATQDIPTSVINRTFIDKVQSGDSGMLKQASDAVNEFTRTRMRERGFYRQIQPFLPISNDELDKQVDTDLPVKVCEKEPGSPAAESIPFGTLPRNRYIHGPRYRVMFARIVTPRFTKDVDELRSYDMDIRQVLSDNAIKDMLAEEDSKFINSVNSTLIGPDVVIPETGVAQWKTMGQLNRVSMEEARKILPSSTGHLAAATALVNNITALDIEKWHRDEVGGDLSEDLLINGFGERKFMSMRWIITIKTDLVPNDNIFYFAEPKFLGKAFVLEDTTMYLKREAFMLEFYAYECIGGAIGNTSAVARATFSPAPTA